MKRTAVRAWLALFALASSGMVFAQEPPAVPALIAPAPHADREIQIASDAFVKNAAAPKWVQPHAIPEAKASGPAVLLLADSQIMVANQPTSYARRAIRINDALVLSNVGRVPIYFIPAYQRVVLHTLQVVREGAVLDRLPAAQVRFLQRETGLENNIYSGVVTASILIDDLRVGDTLELAYSVIGGNPVFGSIYSYLEGWDQSMPIELRRVILNAPVQRKVAWKFQGDLAKDFPRPSETTRDGIRSLVFEEEGLKGMPSESGVPAGFSLYRWIEFSEYASWNAVATWAASLFDDAEAPSAERAALVASLMARPNVEERVVGALEFVQSQVRYFSVSLGTSSHRPIAPNTVLTRRYGDCKDKSLLLIALLKDMGIASTPVLARLGNRTGFDAWLPTPLAFDHVIVEVEVDGKPWFLDPTRLGQHGKLATMGQIHDGSQVLAASAATSRVQRIVVSNRDALTLDERVETLAMKSLDGDGDLTVVQTLHGVAAESARVVLGALPKDRIDAIFTSDMTKRYPGAKLVESMRIADDRDNNRFVATSRYTLVKPMQRADSSWRVGFRPENFLQVLTTPADSARRAPAAMRFPVNVRYVFTAQFPDDVSAAVDPLAATVSDRWFTSTSERSFRGNSAIVTANLRTLTDRIDPADLATLRGDLQKFDRGFPAYVVVRDADLKQSGFLGLVKKDFAASLKSRQEDTVAKISATIKSGRLSGADLARAYCETGAANYSLGKSDEALRDAEAAVQIDPNAADTLACRAEIRIGVRDFKGAIDDASRAIVLGAETGRVYYRRGQAKFHLGRYAEALDDFSKANAVDKDERSTLYHDLWRAMTYRRMKQALPDDLLKHASAEPRGDWPRPALAMLAERVTPDEMNALAARKSGDEAELNGTEADFYRGEFHLSNGDIAKARDAFTASRARGVIIYTEYIASGFELERLEAAAR